MTMETPAAGLPATWPIAASAGMDAWTITAFAAPAAVVLLLLVDVLASPRRTAATIPLWLIVGAASAAILTLVYAIREGQYVFVAAQASAALVFLRVALALGRADRAEPSVPRFPVVAPDAARRERKSNPPS